MDLSPLFITLKVACFGTMVAFITGILAARVVIRMERFKSLADGFFTMPMILPPTVLGFFFLLLIGKNGPVGKFLMHFDMNLIFTWQSAALAASVAAFPLMYRTVRGAFEQVDEDLIYAAQTLGMTNRNIFWKIIFPNSKQGVAAGTILAFARATGEFGATMMLAGNIPGKTQTISIAIYTAVQNGDLPTAYFWTCIIIGLSFGAIIILNGWLLKKST